MRLEEAIRQSDIEVAELYTDSATIVVGIDGGERFEVAWKRGDMPPYAEETVDTIEEVEALIAPADRHSTQWTPIQED